MTQHQIVRASLSTQVREHLTREILSGALRPGDRLVELRIAAELNTSQAPVREALRELEALGLVETRLNKGARVRVIDEKELREIYDVRAELEAYASECVASSGKNITDALDQEIAGMRHAAETLDSILFSDHNTRFHGIIMEAAGNATLFSMWEGLNTRSRTSLNVIRNKSDLLSITASHRILVATLASGDAVAAREAAKAHVQQNKP